MKTLGLLAVVLGLTTALSLRAADGARAAPRAEIIFDHPENFTDVKDGDIPTDSGRDAILARLRDYLVERASGLLPEGYQLRVVFTDIDLAGDFEPWRGPRWEDVRVVKDSYPPAFKFSYAVTDPSGRVVRQGTENIRDLDFQTRVVLSTSDPLRYEKDILNDWMRGALRGLKR